MSSRRAFDIAKTAEPVRSYIDWFKSCHPDAIITEVRLSGEMLVIEGTETLPNGECLSFQFGIWPDFLLHPKLVRI